MTIKQVSTQADERYLSKIVVDLLLERKNETSGNFVSCSNIYF